MKTLTALTIAGFDGGGGAGIQADLKTFSALGCYGLSVLTALPIQNTQGVRSIHPIPEECVRKQCEAIFEDFAIDSIKMGMLHRKEIIEIVADVLQKRRSPHLVLDPVMASTGGHFLLTPEAVEVLKRRLFPMTTLLTPNLPEASLLLGREIRSKNQMEKAAREILDQGPEAVLLKGGHLEGGTCDDLLCYGTEFEWFSSPKIDTKNTHGTGCTFSAAIAAFFAKGYSLRDAVLRAKRYISHCIEEGSKRKIGQGNGPVHHFFEIGI